MQEMPETIRTPNGQYPKISAKTSLDDLLQAVMNATETPQEPPDDSAPASDNPAVARCCHAYTRALKASTERGKGRYDSAENAGTAYRNAMPSLSGHQNIRDFIACTAHSMLLGAITGPDGARLLYAAQVAHTALRSPSPSKNANSPKIPLHKPSNTSSASAAKD